MAHHGRQFHSKQENNSELEQESEEEEDPFDARIKKSGCAEFHYALQVGWVFAVTLSVCSLYEQHMHELYMVLAPTFVKSRKFWGIICISLVHQSFPQTIL